MKKYSTSLNIRYKQKYNEISLHTSQNGHHQKIYKKSGEQVEKRETSGAVCDIVNWYSHYGEHYRESFKT